MFAKFIRRPVLAIVISILITILGIIAIFTLPVTQFPDIAPPEVNVTVQYPGANAVTLTKSVVRPLEMVINGVPGMKYMISTAGNDGTAIIQVRFNVGTNIEMAAVNVQNRVSTVLGSLPVEVRENGVVVGKEVNSMLMYLNISSVDTTLDEKFLYNFAQINIFDELKRIEGVGFIDVMGQREYSIRIWLKPDRMATYHISANEVIASLGEQNIEAAPGQVGESSDKKPLSLQYALLYPGKFTEEKEYGDIIIRSDSDSGLIRLRDIADIDLSTVSFDVKAKKNGHPCASIMIKQMPGSNANDVIKRIRNRMEVLRKTTFLPGMEYSVSYDISKFLSASINEVIKTFMEAFMLVAFVVFLFLKDIRSTLIPIIAIPVSLVGTFFFIQYLGLSINMITLFAMVLVIGIVVDNAIVVVEAVHVKMEGNSLTPMKATEEAMKEISGAIIAMTLVMSAVFIPAAFIKGPAGIFFRQFSVTMAVSIIISGVTALTLSPALCALILKPGTTDKSVSTPDPFRNALNRFDRWYKNLALKYENKISKLASRLIFTFAAILLFLAGTWVLSALIPKGFIPNEDQGTVYGTVTLPHGATIERTDVVVDEVEKVAQSNKSVESVSTLAGQNILADGTGPIYGTLILNLKDWRKRKASAEDIIKEMYKSTSHIKAATLEFFAPPPVPGYSSAGGFEMYLENRSGKEDQSEMQSVTDQFLAELKKRPEIRSVITIFDASFPQYMLYIDYDKAAQKGVTVGNAMDNLQILVGSQFAGNFVRFGKMFKIMVQSGPEYRDVPESILKLQVKNKNGDMVPYSAFMKMEKVYGPEKVIRYNMYTAAQISGDAAPGYSTGEVIKAVNQVASEKLPSGYTFEWSGITYDEVNVGKTGLLIFFISLIFVYLILSGQYESFVLPLPVLLFIPLGTFGAYFFIAVAGLENNIYAQIALLMLIGILGKNAILIVEYAQQRRRAGYTILEAAVKGASIRLRPILMTSFAFAAGLLPLVFASGIGKNGNQTIGTAAVGGILVGTILGIFVIPALYVFFASFSKLPQTDQKQEINK